MAQINPRLLERLETNLRVGRRRLYELISNLANSRLVEREIAALILAAENGISIQRFSTLAERAAMRNGGATLTAAVAPEPSPKATRKVITKGNQGRTTKKTDKNSVFVVHGRDAALRKSLYAFLRSIGLKPLEWEHAILQAKDVNPHIDDVLDAAMARVQAVVILFSPDDDAMLTPKLHDKKEAAAEKKLTGQPRPNVLFEAGMALARHPSKTLILQVGKIRGFSDIAGRHVIRLTDAKEKRNEVINRLEKIGCNVDRHGADWMTEGTFIAARDRRT
jgi:predicted nucleotide-binding protein